MPVLFYQTILFLANYSFHTVVRIWIYTSLIMVVDNGKRSEKLKCPLES